MKMGFFFLLSLMLPGLSMSNPVTTEQQTDYCYKPNKPLLFSKKKYKDRYEQDLKEYQRCVKQFTEFQENISNMKTDSEKNARKILNDFAKQQ